MVGHKPHNDPYQTTFVPQHQFAKRLPVATARILNQPGIRSTRLGTMPIRLIDMLIAISPLI